MNHMSVRSIALLMSIVPGAFAQYDQCSGYSPSIGTGSCNGYNNNPECGYDGGDCCYCSCVEHPDNSACGIRGYDCQDPEYAGNEIFSCDRRPVVNISCPTGTADQWVVNDTTSAIALADALLCYGGIFDVELHGKVFITRTIQVANGTTLRVTGGDPGAEMEATLGIRHFSIMNAFLDVRNINITGGRAIFGGAIAAAGSDLSLENVSFAGNRANHGGGAIYATIGCRISFDNGALFDGNHAGDGGGALYVGANSSLEFHGHTSFTSNTAEYNGGALQVSKSIVSWVGDVSFTNNSADGSGGALHVFGSNLSWSADVSFTNNVGGGQGGALYAKKANISWMTDALFTNNTCDVEGGALYAEHSDLLWAAEATYVNNTALDDGGALYFYYANILWDANASFMHNTAGRNGGAMEVVYSDLSWSMGAWFINNAAVSGGALGLYVSNVSWLVNSSFIQNTALNDGGALEAYQSEASWKAGVSFINNSANDEGGALYVRKSKMFWAAETPFIGNVAGRDGGAAYAGLESTASWRVGALFLGNIAGKNGGALSITGGARGTLGMGTVFLANSASSDGGAINLYGSDDETHVSYLSIDGTTTFLENLSGGDGGAIAVAVSAAITFGAESITFYRNVAHAAGGAISIKGVGMGPKFTALRFVSNYAHIGGAVFVTSSGTATTDHLDDPIENPTTFDRCRFVENEAKATGGAIATRAGLDMITNTYFARNTAGTGGGLRLAGRTSLYNCTFTENTSDNGEGPAISNVGFISNIIESSFLENVFRCKPGEFLDYHEDNDALFGVVCKGCDAGCDQCTTSRVVPLCTEELEHTKSSGGESTIEALVVDRGYWRATKTSRNVLACFNADACLGGVTEIPNYCSKGYEGPYCSICRKGFSPSIGHTCSKCSWDIGTVSVTLIIVTLAILGVVLLLSYLLCSKSEGAGRGPLTSWKRRLLSLKIIIIVWQVLSQFSTVANVVYPGVYQKFLDAVDALNLNLAWVPAAECVLDLDFHHRLIMSTLGPLAILTILGMMYMLTRWKNCASQDGSGLVSYEIDRKYLTVVLVVTFLVYSSVSATLFRMFACDELDDGKTYLRADYRIDCKSPTHRTLQIYSGCMMVVYLAGIPVLYGVLLFWNRQVLMDGSARQDDAVAKSISNLWELYKPGRFYYELVECARRVLLAGVVVFIFPNTVAQVAVVLMLAISFMILSEMMDPYESRWDTWINRLGHAIIFSSIYLALLLKIDVSNEREDSQRIFEGVLLASHACMFLVVIVQGILFSCLWVKEERGSIFDLQDFLTNTQIHN